jgi:hypothetical protein
VKYMLIHCIEESAESGRRPGEDHGGPAIEDWITEMEGRGVLRHGDRLRYVNTATTVRVRSSELMVSDGPFAETKEQVAGYDVIDCADLDEAIEIASKHPTAWWGTIEVRPIADGHHGDAGLAG